MRTIAMSRQVLLLATLLLANFWTASAVAQTVTVKVASTNREVFDNLPLYVGTHAGMFKKEGIDVEVTHFSGGGEVVRAVASRSMNIGMVSATGGIIAAGRGEPVRIIAGWTAPAYGILYVVPKDSPLKSVKDLAGKKVGITRPGSVSHTGLTAALQANGILGKVDIVPVGAPGDGWTILKTGRVQATWHTAPDVYALVDRGEARILFHLSEYLKEYQQGALLARLDYLDANGETVRKFLRAAVRAAEFISTNPAEAAKIGAKAMGLPEPALARTIADMPKGFFNVAVPTPGNFAGSMSEVIDSGALKAAPPYDKVVDTRFLK